MVVIKKKKKFTRSVGPYFFDENEKEKHNKQTNKISTNIDDDDIYQIASQVSIYPISLSSFWYVYYHQIINYRNNNNNYISEMVM